MTCNQKKPTKIFKEKVKKIIQEDLKVSGKNILTNPISIDWVIYKKWDAIALTDEQKKIYNWSFI